MYFILVLFICVCVSTYIYYHKFHLLNKIIEKFKPKKYYTITINKKSDVNIISKYIIQHSPLIQEIHIGEIKYPTEEISILQSLYSAMDTYFSYIRPSLNTKVYFEDRYLNIRGYVSYHETNDNINIENTKPSKNARAYTPGDILKTDMIIDDDWLQNNLGPPIEKSNFPKKKHIYIKMFIEQNEKSVDLLDIFVKIQKKTIGTDNKLYYKLPNNMDYCTIIKKKSEISVKHDPFIHMKSFFHDQSDELWGFVKHRLMFRDHEKMIGRSMKINLLLHGPPGSGKSTFIRNLSLIIKCSISELDFIESTIKSIHSSIEWCKKDKDILYIKDFDDTLDELSNRKDEIDNNKKLDTKFTLSDFNKFIKGHSIIPEIRVIIATTYNFDKIKNIYSDLLSYGMFTPVHFGYISKETLQDICEFYFKKKIEKRLPEHIQIPTSQIINLALTHGDKHNGFDLFVKDLFELL